MEKIQERKMDPFDDRRNNKNPTPDGCILAIMLAAASTALMGMMIVLFATKLFSH
jgi:hypothetical protein